MIGWHHQFNGHEFEQSPEVSEEQEILAWSSPWGHRVNMTEQLNNSNKSELHGGRGHICFIQQHIRVWALVSMAENDFL